MPVQDNIIVLDLKERGKNITTKVAMEFSVHLRHENINLEKIGRACYA